MRLPAENGVAGLRARHSFPKCERSVRGLTTRWCCLFFYACACCGHARMLGPSADVAPRGLHGPLIRVSPVMKWFRDHTGAGIHRWTRLRACFRCPASPPSPETCSPCLMGVPTWASSASSCRIYSRLLGWMDGLCAMFVELQLCLNALPLYQRPQNQ